MFNLTLDDDHAPPGGRHPCPRAMQVRQMGDDKALMVSGRGKVRCQGGVVALVSRIIDGDDVDGNGGGACKIYLLAERSSCC